MTKEINYKGDTYQFRYEITGALYINEGIGVYLKNGSRWEHKVDLDYFDLDERENEYFEKLIDKYVY